MLKYEFTVAKSKNQKEELGFFLKEMPIFV